MSEAHRAARRLAYLERYHEITQSLIGVMRLNATPGQREQVRTWDEALDDLQVARWHELGVSFGAMGRAKMFVVDDAAVERVKAALTAEALLQDSGKVSA